MSIRSPVPQPSSAASFASIFQTPQSSSKWKPADVIYTLNTVIGNMDGSQSQSSPQSLHESVMSQSSSNNNEVQFINGQPQVNIEEAVKKFRPFNKPPAPIPLDPAYQQPYHKHAAKLRQSQAKQQRAGATPQSTDQLSGATTYSASATPIVQQSSKATHAPPALPSRDARSRQLPHQPFLQRMNERGISQYVKLLRRVKASQFAAETSEAEEVEGRQNPDNHAGLPSDMNINELGSGSLWESRDMLLISSRMSSGVPSNLRVFVSFKEDTVFAGEDVEATITFKNVEPIRPTYQKTRQRSSAAVPQIHESPTSTQIPPSLPPSRPAHSRQASVASRSSRPQPSPAQARRTSQLGHRQALSLNVLDASSKKIQPSAPQSALTAPGTRRGSKDHGRSISIVSIGNDVENKGHSIAEQRDSGRQAQKLARSASVQVTPTTGASSRWGYSASHGGYKAGPSPLATTTPASEGFPWDKPGADSPQSHTRHVSMGNGLPPAPRLAQSRTPSGRIPKMPPSSFKFPPSPSASTALPQDNDPDETPRMESVSFSPTTSTATMTPAVSDIPPPSTRVTQPSSAAPRLISPERRPTPNRVFSLSSETGTPRSSTDVYSSSNLSDETMASEIPSVGSLLKRPGFFRNTSSKAQMTRRTGPEALMMGFANITGNFQLDGSLVSQAPFEEVKRRAVVGGHGAGGVVGVDQRKGQSGFFGGFSWSGLGESLGSILGSDQQSTIRDMKNTAESNSIPLLSTPQSVLFVDLRLAPGESRSYNYSFTLPRGLPPSHRGRAMKVSYQIVIGTQRPNHGRTREQQIHEVGIPFRVFGGVDTQGEILGHDLMSPYVILRDQARSSQVEVDSRGRPTRTSVGTNSQTAATKSSEADFNSYVHKLLSSPRRNSSTGLISPSATNDTGSSNSTPSRRPSGYPLPPPPPTRELVDSAIRLSSHQRGGDQGSTSQTNFTIARAGNPVAKMTLSRPTLRLGDLLNLTLDFSSHLRTHPLQAPRVLVHAVTLSLESSEHVDPSLSVRSAASIERATRRVWDRRVVGGAKGAALGWCKRWAGTLKIPSNATPTFSTTGVECKWVVRVEIAVGVTPNRQQESSIYRPGDGGLGADESDEEDDHQGEGAARRRQERESQLPSKTLSSSENAFTPSHSPRLTPTNSLRRKTTLTRRNTLTRRRSGKQKKGDASANVEEQAFIRSRQLLERVADDERGVTLAAVRRIPGDVFEIAVPIRIFGAIGVTSGEPTPAEEGLPV
ncbi:MAG: hypothetical protein Q9162_006658 [Coniocarpon cinnabarinum]